MHAFSPTLFARSARLLAVLLTGLLVTQLSVASARASENHEARVTLLKNRDYLDEIVTAIRNSRKSIIFSYYLFKARGGNDPAKIADELVHAQKRGVDVVVILERTSAKDKLNEENLHTAALLARGGVKVFFDSPDVTSHMKVALIDGRYVFIGSHNLSESALTQNNEVSVMIDSPSLARELKAYLNQL